MDNILFCSVGRRVTLLKSFRELMNGCGKLMTTDLNPVAFFLFVLQSGRLTYALTSIKCSGIDEYIIMMMYDEEVMDHKSELTSADFAFGLAAY